MTVLAKFEVETLTIFLPSLLGLEHVSEYRIAYEAYSEKLSSVIVDFENADLITSAGIGMLLNMRNTLGDTCTIRFTNCNHSIQRLLRICQLNKMFEF